MRNSGLDIARTIAILTVVLAHFLQFYYKDQFLTLATLFGVLGVEIFFVLSGFLIGQIIISEVIDQPKPSKNALARFYLRRWFRTLPLYYLILGISALIHFPYFRWECLFFIENFQYLNNVPEYVPGAWSLAIEEWFYLLVPALLLGVTKLNARNKIRVFFITITLIIVISTAGRAVWVLTVDPSWDNGIRRQIFLRMDSLIIGVFLVGVKSYLPTLYKRLTRSSVGLLAGWLGGFCMIGLIYFYEFDVQKTEFRANIWFKIFQFNLIPIFALMLVAGLESSKRINIDYNKNVINRVCQFISKISYSIYLTHVLLLYIFFAINNLISSSILKIIWQLLSLVLVILVGYLLYKGYELPFLRLREKFDLTRDNKPEKTITKQL